MPGQWLDDTSAVCGAVERASGFPDEPLTEACNRSKLAAFISDIRLTIDL